MYAEQRYQRRLTDHESPVASVFPPARDRAPGTVGGWRLGESLPFRLVVARSPEQIDQAVDVRRAAYAIHMPEFAEYFRSPEPEDYEPGSLVLLALSKVAGEPIGTLRIGSNLHGPTEFEKHLDLPQQFVGQPCAYLSRLGVRRGQHSNEVKLALFKAMHRYCLATQLRFLLIAGVPPRDRWYDRLGFADIREEGRMFELPSCYGRPARVQWAEVARFESMWRESNHPLYDFMFKSFFPDIEVFSSVSSMWSRPRRPRVDAAAPAPLQDSFGLAVI